MNISKGLLAGLVLAILILGGLTVYAFTREDNNSNNTDQMVDDSRDSSNQPQDTNVNRNDEQDSVTDTGSQNTEDTRVIDGVEIPISILESIESQYPDYIIDDADREVEGGQVYYEIELEHSNPANDTEIDLYYDADWNLIRTSTD